MEECAYMKDATKQTVSLVLGSGGARGLAHIGVIRWLEENRFDIRSICGCSMGALIGGIYAAGKLDDYQDWVSALRRIDIVTLLDFSWKRSGFVKGDKIINTLVELVGDRTIEDLPVSFTAVAADVVNEREVWLKSGRLFDAIRASISLPFFFTPFLYGGIHLIDGGVLNPVPIAPTFGDATDRTIAVNLGGPAVPVLKTVKTMEPKAESSALQAKVRNYISRFKLPKKADAGTDWGMYEIASQAFDAMQNTIARQKLAAYPPDLIIEIPRNACGTLEFFRASEMIDLGYQTAGARLGHLV
jgi:NTE family protein